MHRFIFIILGFFPIIDSFASSDKVAQILARLNDAQGNRGHIIVVAHRGLWNKEAKAVYPENSIASIRKAIELGVEIIEQDIRKSKDGIFVVLHDQSLDRTTTCSGLVAEKTWAELQKCQLKIVNAEQEIITSETVLSLEQLYQQIKGKILLNLDNKIDYSDFPAMFKLAEKHGVVRQIIVTIGQNSRKQQQNSKLIYQSAQNYPVIFMPFLSDKYLRFKQFKQVLKDYKPRIIQVNHQHNLAEKLTQDGGVFFSHKAHRLLKKYNTHYWLNTLYDAKSPGSRSGGRGDEMAYYAKSPEEVFGFWIDKGVSIFQTDEPELLISWLNTHKYRQPYE